QAAFMGALALLLTPGFVILGRTVLLDSLLTTSVAASWYGAHLAVLDRRLHWPVWLLSALVCGLGMLAKGPVALVLVLPPVLAYQLLMPAAARPRWLPWMAYVATAVVVAAPWYTFMAWKEPTYLEHFFWKANLLRFVSPYDHEQPWWFYIPV